MLLPSRTVFSLILALVLFGGTSRAEVPAPDGPTGKARAALLAAVADYVPGEPVDPALDARIKAEAALLEDLAGPVDLSEDPALWAGTWALLYDSRNLLAEIPLAFARRNFPGIHEAEGMARVRMTTQELQPDWGIYRNTMVLEVGEPPQPVLYRSTAGLGVDPDQPDHLQVSFRFVEFVPGDARLDFAATRAALGLDASAPLHVAMPARASPSTSQVTYLDGDIRVNRGSDYIAVLRRVQ